MTTMTGYPVMCGCGAAAAFKIAAPWNDGDTSEFKTYSLCCEKCLEAEFASAKRRHAACPTEPSETLGEPEVFALRR